MKVLVLLCFAVLACYQAAAFSRAEIFSLLQTEYGIDDVLKILQALRDDQSGQITQLDQEAPQREADFADKINGLTDILNQQVAQCNADDQAVQQGGADAQKLRDAIQQSQDSIETNNQNAEAAADQRCASNLLFISELGDREEAVEFLTYLRGRVADPSFVQYLNEQGGSFLQLKTALATKQENEILSLIAKHHILTLMQTKQDYEGQSQSELDGELTARSRTSEEIGTDYQDNSRGALEVQGITDDSLSAEQLVGQLLGYIDALIADLQKSITDLQAVETQAVQAFIEYRRQLKDQNYVYQQYIDQATAALANTEATNTNNQQAAEQCHAKVPPLQENVKRVQDEKAEYEAANAQKRQSLVDTLALLDEVIQVYTDEVVNVATEEQKARADDYLGNQQQPVAGI